MMTPQFKAFPSQIKELPAEPHFVVFTNGTIYHEGDQRSRDYPGHGYSSYTEEIVKMQVLESEEALKKWIISNGKEQFKVFKLMPVSFEIETKIKIVD